MVDTHDFRAHTPTHYLSRWYQNGVNTNNLGWDTYDDIFQTGEQSTHGYRSGARAAEDNPGDFERTSGSHVEFLRDLVTENKTDFGRKPSDNGHEFLSDDRTITWNPPVDIHRPSGMWGDIRYTGYCQPILSPSYPSIVYPTSSEKVTDGARLVSMTIPTKSELQLAQFFGELRERLPTLIGFQAYRRGLSSNVAGSEYLNVKFGWSPLINDIQNVARGVVEFSKRTKQLQRNSGKHIRRRAQLDSSSNYIEQPSISSGPTMPPYGVNDTLPGYFWDYMPETRVEDVYHSDVWFSGAYSYLLYEGHSFLSRLEEYEQKANNLLGLELTPQLVWELTPWSWLFDWHLNVGVFLTNVDLLSKDSTVLRYGYVMHRTSAFRTYSKFGMVPNSLASAPTSLTTRLSITRKERMRADPYGFGLLVSDYSPTQWAILAALGMTKTDTSLRR